MGELMLKCPTTSHEISTGIYVDEDGFFWFAGRDNDMFKVRGLWVAPIEIVNAHPELELCAAASGSSQATFAPETAVGRWWFSLAASALFGTLLSWQLVFRPRVSVRWRWRRKNH